MKTNLKKGFSLIEMIFYVVILFFMLAIVIQVVYSIAKNDRIIESVRSIENSAINTLERVSREVRGAESVATTTGSLILNRTSTTTSEFYLSLGRVYLKENGVVTGALTEADATVTSLIFTRFATSTIEGVRTAITVEAGTSTHYRVENFYSSAVIR